MRFRCASLNTLIIYSSVFYVVIVKVIFKQSNCFNLIAERIACTLLVFCYFLFHLLEKSSLQLLSTDKILSLRKPINLFNDAS